MPGWMVLELCLGGAMLVRMEAAARAVGNTPRLCRRCGSQRTGAGADPVI